MTASNASLATEKVGITDTMVIRNQEIPVSIGFLEQTKLRYYPDNPRVYSIVRDNEKEPTQEEIQGRLLEMEHVKELIRDIKLNGGLIEPLIVRDGSFEVLEGNSRLAAYRFLAKADPIAWGLIKCTVLPKDVGEPLVFAILGQHHIKGKKDWAPYEQAGFMYRRHKYHSVDLDTLAQEIGLPKSKIKHLIDTYQFMVDHEENDVNRWSYYDEYLKSSKVRRAKKRYPALDDLIVQKINSGEIGRAMDLRDQLPTICTGPSKNLKKFVARERSFSEAFEAAEEAGGDNIELRKLAAFRNWVVKIEIEDALAHTRTQVRQKIVFELDKISARVQALRKKLEDH